MSNKMVQFVLLTREQYDNTLTKESRTLYFISDTLELYRGEVNFSKAVVFYNKTVDDTRPATGVLGKIYINTQNGEGSSWDGTTWQVVIPAISASVVTQEAPNGVTNPVSGAAVKSYVETVAASTLTNCVTAVTYDGTNKQLQVTKNGTVTNVPLTKLGVSLSYDGSTGVMSLKDIDNTTLSTVNIPLDNFVTGGSYNDTTKKLVLTMQNGTSVEIPAGDLVKLYNDLDTTSVNVTIATDATTGQNTISANVIIDPDTTNALELRNDGLYVPPATTKMNKVGTGHDDEVITADATGDAAASGYKIGGSTLYAGVAGETDAQIAAKQETLLATEAAVAAVKTAIIDQADLDYVKVSDVITSAANIDADDPSTTKVISESALVEALEWVEL